MPTKRAETDVSALFLIGDGGSDADKNDVGRRDEFGLDLEAWHVVCRNCHINSWLNHNLLIRKGLRPSSSTLVGTALTWKCCQTATSFLMLVTLFSFRTSVLQPDRIMDDAWQHDAE